MALNRFWNLLAKKLSGEAMPADLVELERIMKEHPEWVYAAEHIEHLWHLRNKETDCYDAELAFELHLNEQRKKGLDLPELETPEDLKPVLAVYKKNHSKKWLIAAVVTSILILATVKLLYLPHSRTVVAAAHKSLGEVSTTMGSKSRVVLSDSTVVWLNAGSKLTYEEGFGVTNRNTVLSGEAFFEVKHSGIPFIIKAQSVHIKVMGTSFNVKSYPNEKTTETSLIRGKIEITIDRRPGAKFILSPNEKLIVANDTASEQAGVAASTHQKPEPIVVLGGLTRTEEEEIVETSWVENRLMFQDETFVDIAKKLERWYNVSIKIDDPRIAAMHLTGTFENETIRQALEALQIASKFNFTISENRITITQ